MRASDACLEIIKRFEGFRAKPYLCPAGVPTIGYGSTYYPGGRRVTMGDHAITEEKATAMLVESLQGYERSISEHVSVPLQQHELDALVSFTYNVGVHAFANSTLLRLLNSGKRQGAAAQFMRWVKAGDRALPGLVKRRHAEAKLFMGVK